MEDKNEIKLENMDIFQDETEAALERFAMFIVDHKKMLAVLIGCLIIIPSVFLVGTHKFSSNLMNGNLSSVSFAISPFAATSSQKSVITIPSGMVKANPFVPYRNLENSAGTDVPIYNLVEPPEVLNENSDAARIMDTIVSGILYDKYSPSAILNIEGTDYLVKKGDVVNNYKVMDIAQNSVTVKLGANVYKAGIGEILTEGKLNHNEVSNLNNKFGGEK